MGHQLRFLDSWHAKKSYRIRDVPLAESMNTTGKLNWIRALDKCITKVSVYKFNFIFRVAREIVLPMVHANR